MVRVKLENLDVTSVYKAIDLITSLNICIFVSNQFPTDCVYVKDLLPESAPPAGDNGP